MRFTDAIILLLLSSILALTVSSGLWVCRTLERRTESQRSIYSERFIAESFRKSCKGQGFKDLNEWQICCRNMFDLDYIGWSNANEFMDVSKNNCQEDLYYGCWKKNGRVREVYCRKKFMNQREK